MTPYARGNPARWWRSRGVGRWGGAHRSPGAMFISPLRRFASIVALCVLLLLIVGGWWVTNPRRVSRMAEVLLSEVLGGSVEVRSGRVSLSGTLLLSGVQLKTEKGGDAAHTVFAADELEVRFDWLSLLTGKLHATQVTAVHPTLILVEDLRTQRWNYERLLSGQREGGGGGGSGGGEPMALPVIVLREARVQWGESSEGRLSYTGATVIDGQLLPDVKLAGAYRLKLEERGELPLGPREKPTAVTGTWHVYKNLFSASISDIDLSERMRRSLPRLVRDLWDRYQLKGRLTALRTTFEPKEGLILHVEPKGVAMTMTLDESMLLTRQKEYVGITGVHGKLEVRASTGSVKFENLSGRILGHEFVTSGELRGASAESPFDMTVTFPNARLDTYPRLAFAEPHTRGLIERLRPQGLMDLSVTARRSAWNGKVAVDGDVNCKDVAIRFPHFPFPLRKVQGKVHFTNDYVSFDKVGAMADDCAILLDGSCGITPDDQHIDFTVSSEDAVFDQRLAACLPERFVKIWDQLEPWGRGRFSCHVERPRDNAAAGVPGNGPRTRVEVDLVDGRGRFAGFPYPLSGAQGRLVFGDDHTTVENLRLRAGGDGSGTIVINGVVKHPGGDIENLQPVLQVVATGLPIDDLLLDALPAEMLGWRKSFELTGRLGLQAQVRRGASGNAAPEVEGVGTLESGTFTSKDGAIALTGMAAKVGISPAKIAIESLTGKVGEVGTVSVRGGYVVEAGVLDLEIGAEWRDWKLSPEPPAFLAGRPGSELWTRLKPRGPVDGDLSAKIHLNSDQLSAMTAPPATAPATAPALDSAVEGYTLHLRPKGLAISPPELPGSVDDIHGTVTITPTRITMADITAKAAVAKAEATTAPVPATMPAMTISCAATYDRKSEALSISGKLDAPAVPVVWLPILGPEASAAILSQKPEGAFVLTLQGLQRSAPDKPWEFTGDLVSKAFRTQAEPAPLSATEIVLAASGKWEPGKLVFGGSLDAATLVVTGRTCEKFHSSLECESSVLKFPDIDTTVAQGKLQGKITVHLGDPPAATSTAPAAGTQDATRPGGAGRGGGGVRYDGALVLSDAELSELLLGPKATEEERKKVGHGRVTANIAVQENFGGGAGRTGRGELVVRDGEIYNVPLSMGLMQLATLRLPVSRAFDSASMSYYIRDNKVTFERILMESAGINLAGAGTLNLSDRHLDMTFVTETPNELKLPIITELFALTRHELLQVQVTGPAENPQIRAVPLTTLANTLQAILPRKRKD